MSVRIPHKLSEEPDDIKLNLQSGEFNVLRIVDITDGLLHEIWELISSTFLDKTGNPFYDKTGIPFQGKQE